MSQLIYFETPISEITSDLKGTCCEKRSRQYYLSFPPFWNFESVKKIAGASQTFPHLPFPSRKEHCRGNAKERETPLAPCLRLFSAVNVYCLFIRYKYANKPLLLFKERAKPNQCGSGNCSTANTGNGKWCFHYKLSEKQLWEWRQFRNGQIQATTNWKDKKCKTRGCSTQEEKKLQWVR